MTNRYSWLAERPLREPLVLGSWDGLSNIMLFEIPSGALLWWMFEENDEESLGVFVHLDDDEAQAVYEGASAGGLLEPVRERLKDSHAVVWSWPRSGEPRVAPFEIPVFVPESEFIKMLWSAAEATLEPLEDSAAKAFGLAQASC
ncbi:hypothetical protein IU429_05875 [Nocardia elegans]|uniref:hypothetical protein n=1 Tax=Nocardia elegans TaxID=300029 RepID=UPI0018934FEA|nr:hypothetical protein [Nocardia elegans]MBF6447188.1 hypothetical protein [Nocardia elegans]